MMAASPLAPESIPALPPIAGVWLAVANSGIRYKNRPDLLLVAMHEATQAAGVFTRSLCPAASIDWCRGLLPEGKARALIVNAGNANAFTGKAGDAAVKRIAAATAQVLPCKPHEVWQASTGVIGVPLPDEKIIALLPGLAEQCAPDRWSDAAAAILTTDTFPKMATRSVWIGSAFVTLNGIAKGSGMIAPDMATMLAFLFTDAAIPAPVLQALLLEATELSFNRITVDGDTSTSDMALLFATGQTKHAAIQSKGAPALQDFREALVSLCVELAQLIIRDGEGARKFVTIRITGAASDSAAKRIGLAVGNSPLVKTAIAGEDANWGRIVAAIGKAGEQADRDRLRIAIGGVLVAENGAAHPAYREADVTTHMKGKEILIEADVGVGQGQATVWTCDLTHGYIDINGSYRS